MPKNKIDLELLKKQCKKISERSVYRGEVVGVNTALNTILAAKETDWEADLEQIQWERIVNLENDIKSEITKLQDRLAGTKQVRALFQSQN